MHTTQKCLEKENLSKVTGGPKYKFAISNGFISQIFLSDIGYIKFVWEGVMVVLFSTYCCSIFEIVFIFLAAYSLRSNYIFNNCATSLLGMKILFFQ